MLHKNCLENQPDVNMKELIVLLNPLTKAPLDPRCLTWQR